MRTGPKEYLAIRTILGGDRVIRRKIENEFDLIDLARKGLSVKSIHHLRKYLNIQLAHVSKTLHITPRTLQRKERERKNLDTAESEHAIEIARVISKGIQVFGTVGTFREWLESPVHVLHGAKPVSLLDTTFGTTLLLDELGRIEHGVYS